MELNKKYITIKKKAYTVWSDTIDDYDLGYLMDEVCYANNISEAKTLFLKNNSEYECTFIELKAKRKPDRDIMVYDDGITTIEGNYSSIVSKLADKFRMDKIKEFPDETMFYIQNNREYVGNSVLWWAIDGHGYTTNIDKAWRVTKEYILSQSWRSYETFWECESVDNTVSRHIDMQNLRNINKY